MTVPCLAFASDIMRNVLMMEERYVPHGTDVMQRSGFWKHHDGTVLCIYGCLDSQLPATDRLTSPRMNLTDSRPQPGRWTHTYTHTTVSQRNPRAEYHHHRGLRSAPVSCFTHAKQVCQQIHSSDPVCPSATNRRNRQPPDEPCPSDLELSRWI